MRSIEDVIAHRRTSKDFDGQQVSKEFIERALNAANWAPNHKLNQPWRFKVSSPTAIQKWIDHLKAHLSPEDFKAMEQALERVQKVGTLLYVSCLKDGHPVTDLENYGATCAGIQNILLLATAEGLQSYWSTGKVFAHSLSLSFWGIPESERFVGAIWLGHAKVGAAKPRKDFSEFTRWL